MNMKRIRRINCFSLIRYYKIRGVVLRGDFRNLRGGIRSWKWRIRRLFRKKRIFSKKEIV